MSNGLITKSSPINFGGTNKMLQQLIPILAQKKMLDLRNQNMMKYLETQQQGYRDVQSQGHQFNMAEIQERMFADLAQMPEVDQIKGVIFDKERRGEDATGERAKLEKVVARRVKGMFPVMTGRQPTYDEVSAISETFSERGVETFGSQSAQNVRTGATVGLGYENLKARYAEMAQTQQGRSRDDWKAYYDSAEGQIKSIISHLEGQGVEKAGVGDFLALFSTGKKLDPLSPEDQGQALAGLHHLWSKIRGMKRLSPQEETWMTDVVNAFSIRERGGVPSQETGLTGPETERIDTAWDAKQDATLNQLLIDQAIKFYMDLANLDEATARQRAIALIAPKQQQVAPSIPPIQ